MCAVKPCSTSKWVLCSLYLKFAGFPNHLPLSTMYRYSNSIRHCLLDVELGKSPRQPLWKMMRAQHLESRPSNSVSFTYHIFYGLQQISQCDSYVSTLQISNVLIHFMEISIQSVHCLQNSFKKWTSFREVYIRRIYYCPAAKLLFTVEEA